MFERKFQNLVSSSSPSAPPPAAEPAHASPELHDKKPIDPHAAARQEDEHDQKITFRLKSAAGAGLILLVLYAVTHAPGIRGATQIEEDLPVRRLSEQEQFEALRASHDTERAKSKQGFLQRIFCGSHRRSTFCD